MKVVRQLSDEKVLREKLVKREAELKRGCKDDEAELEILYSLEIGLKREANTLLDLHMTGVIDRDSLQERMAVVREKQAGIAKSKAEVTARLARSESGPGSEEAMKRLCAIARVGLPLATFEEKRMFLEGMDISLHLDGNKVTVTGLITDRTLTIADNANRERAQSQSEIALDVLRTSPARVIFLLFRDGLLATS